MAIKIPFSNRIFNLTGAGKPAQTLETRLEGTLFTRVMAEFVGNSALFPILDGIHSASEYGLPVYLQEVSHYVLFVAALVQAWYLGSHPKQTWYNRFLGNLIGVSLYTILEVGLEGITFFQAPNHLVFWGYSLTLATLNAWQQLAHRQAVLPTILLNVARLGLLPVIYFVIKLGPQATVGAVTRDAFAQFTASESHQFIIFGTLFFGLLMGLSEAQILDYATFLRQAAGKLKEYSEWSLDSTLINSAFSNEQAFQLRRVERTVMFMDIRGFTAWTEQIDPAQTVEVLNQYYNLSEKAIARFKGHKPGFAADEVMTRFNDPAQAVAAARALQIRIGNFLMPHNLSVGIGLHTGVLMEGLLGSNTTKQFDIIGDTVNTAKRLESAAKAGEILISAATRAGLSAKVEVGQARYLNLKGKSEPVAAYPVVI